MIERQHFREAMSRLGAAVNIITTLGPEGDTGFTASAVSSVTDDPATLLVCMNRASRQHDCFVSTGFLCVNILSGEDEHLSPIFAGQGGLSMQERFARADWYRLMSGAPALTSAAAVLDCKIDQLVAVGTHSVLFCAVQAVRFGDDCSGLVYHRRAYHKLLDTMASSLPG